jgi:RNA polymerase sigma-70 factor (ECF subfamily)
MAISGLLSWFREPIPEQVVRDHAQSVYRHLRRIFGPQADIDDVFQSVFVEIIRSLPDFRGRARLSTWIRRITWNVAYQEMRQSYRRPPLVELEERPASAVNNENAEAKLAKVQALRRLYEALDAMDPRERIAVLLHDVEGYTLKEISASLGRPLQTIASRLHSGREHLAEQLGMDLTGESNHAVKDDRKRESHDGEL